MQLMLKLALAALVYGVADTAIVSLYFPGARVAPNVALTASGVDSAGHTTWAIRPATSAAIRRTSGIDTAHPSGATCPTVVEDAPESDVRDSSAVTLPTAAIGGQVFSPAQLSFASVKLPAVGVVPVEVDDAAKSGAPRRATAGVFGVVTGVVAGALMLGLVANGAEIVVDSLIALIVFTSLLQFHTGLTCFDLLIRAIMVFVFSTGVLAESWERAVALLRKDAYTRIPGPGPGSEPVVDPL
ncbi:uncharacterized protein BXZ73DRAFT_105916 [Epithele typhae]|uniref:uncharacterized protein n=1 Tax=Epithele typhae TaxID=378194 RepID=UPI002008C851|nr:uncharacterized protein BXZ73DRAFT_105916 [Epithele typhae]KAH9916289.1 hypothetical protein BXZ73DRAFT_105916 [Epithele typhae]